MTIANFIVIDLQITKVTDEGRFHPLSWPYQNPKSLALSGLRTFIVDKSWRQIFFKPFELTILVVNISISRKKNMLTVVTRGSFFEGD